MSEPAYMVGGSKLNSVRPTSTPSPAQAKEAFTFNKIFFSSFHLPKITWKELSYDFEMLPTKTIRLHP